MEGRSIKLIDLLYPRRCPVCHEIVTFGELIHQECEKKLSLIDEPKCYKCGKRLENPRDEYCENCKKMNFSFNEGVTVFNYDEIMKAVVSDFKFHNKRENADYFVKIMNEACKEKIIEWQPDALVPIPLHKKKKKIRGYNQSLLLAKGVGLEYNVKTYEDLIIRNVETKPQKELNSFERLKNLEHAFSFNEKYANHNLKRIVLIDDIFTTGSTIEACTRVCQKQGIKDVFFICLCGPHNY